MIGGPILRLGIRLNDPAGHSIALLADAQASIAGFEAYVRRLREEENTWNDPFVVQMAFKIFRRNIARKVALLAAAIRDGWINGGIVP